MRILFIAPYVPSRIRVRPYYLVRELARQHDLTILATDTPQALAGRAELTSWARQVELVPLRWPRAVHSGLAAALRGDPIQAGVCHSPEFDARLRTLLQGERFDLVHVEHLRAARLIGLLPPRLPRLYDAVDSISLLLARTRRSSHSLRQRLLAAVELQRTRAFEARVLRRVHHTIVTSADDARALGELAPGAPVTVIPNGVDLEYFQPRSEPREPATLVFSGKMSYHANATAVLHFVRHIFPHVRTRHPGVRLLIVGSQPPRAVRDLAADPSITVTGYVPDIRAYLGRATLAICPVTVKVGIQNKLLEAMAMGLPTVATRAGAAGLAALDGRDLLVADTPAAFADHVNRLLTEAELARRVGQAGRHYVEQQHRWGASVRQLEALYRQAVSSTISQSGHADGENLPRLS